MNSNIKKQVLIGVIILLVIINLSALITIIFHNKQENNQLTQEEFIREDPRQKGMNYYLRDELNLSNEQFDSFQNINKQYFKESKDIASNLHNKRILMLEEIANKDPNLKNLDQIAKEIGDLHYELKLNTIDHFLALKSICNEEQQILLQDFFMKMIDNQDQGQFRRREGPGRNRHQRTPRRNN
jgi:hypothetical protein